METGSAASQKRAGTDPSSVSSSVSSTGSPTSENLTFPLVARLELDELLTQLVDRAQDVLATQSRLRGLLAASRAIATDLRLPVLLRHIVEAACELLDARYGALGVVAPDRTLEEFVHAGMDPRDVDRIGHLPTGHGVLGLLIDDPRPRRLDDISRDPSAYGFPPGHPPMRTFLGVPITVRGEMFGNLYLTEKRGGTAFTAEDEELALALAASAGVAIENARLFHDTQQRHRWMSASADVTRQIMADADGALESVAERVRTVADAEFVSIVLRDEEAGSARVAVAVTVGADTVSGAGQRIPLDGTLTGRVMAEQQPLRVEDAQLDALPEERDAATGPLIVLPMVAGTDHVSGVLLVGRNRGKRPFSDTDLASAASFAGNVAITLELARVKADRERLVVLADRGRIARDLHDHVIQRMFAVALGLQDIAQYERPSNAERINQYVEDLDVTIKDIRRSIFELRASGASKRSRLHAAIDRIAEDVRPALGFTPTVRYSGPLETVIGDDLADQVIAVARESLTNAARHSQAGTVELRIGVAGESVVVDVIDDGVGIGPGGRRSGLDNLRTRAEQLGGSFTLTTPAGGGTHLHWAAPL
jgi:signal transduction histidine kinase